MQLSTWTTCIFLLSLQETHHNRHIGSFLKDYGRLYQDVKLISPEEKMDGAASHNLGLCVQLIVNCVP